MDKIKGYGTYYYTDKDYYEGEWYANKRSGWGRQYYKNGDIYEGEWLNDERSGKGMLRLGFNLRKNLDDFRYELQFYNSI